MALSIVALAPAARASEPFPDVIQAQLKLKDPPLCTVCHLTLIGGVMTVTKPFGRNLMQKYGLKMLDIAGLQSAITQAQANGDDSDGDRVGDIAELIQGTDPNVPEGGVAVEETQYGIHCSVPPTGHSSTAATAAWISGLVLVGLRRRATRRSRVAAPAPRVGPPHARVERKS